jgi:hypothetical protein
MFYMRRGSSCIAVLFLVISLQADAVVAAPQESVASTEKMPRNAAPASAAVNTLPPAVIVNVGTAAPASVESAHSGEDKSRSSQPEWFTAWGTIALAVTTFVLAIFTGGMWAATLKLSKDAKVTAERQAAEVKESLTTGARSADAMERVAAVTKDNADLMQAHFQKQMRAYIVVNAGMGTYQDENNRFAAMPIIENTGFTPAKNVSFKITADTLPAQLPPDFEFRNYGVQAANDATLGPRQTFVINGIVANRLSKEEAEAVMKGDVRALYAWGTVEYEDVFGRKWQTHFCHIYSFVPGAKDQPVQVRSRYHNLHNNMT